MVGEASGNFPPGPFADSEVFRWTVSEGITFFETGEDDLGTELSSDGSVMVGGKEFMTVDGNVSVSYRWTVAEGFLSLGDIVGGVGSNTPFDVSPDGNVLVGIASQGAANRVAYRWTESTGMVSLGDLPGGGVRSEARGVSADGNIVVGIGTTGNPLDASGREAFIWDPTNGMQNLQQVLENDFGLASELAGWTLVQANDISDDGRVIVGTGINPQGNQEAWAAIIPEPSGLCLFAVGFSTLTYRRRNC